MQTVTGSPARRWIATGRLGFWLGWKVESNWTDPFRFTIYSLLRPLGGVLILVFMFRVIAGGGSGPMLSFFVAGAAFWPFVQQGMQGLANGVISDREHWKMIRYVYTSPIPYPAYLIGRGLAHTASAVAAAFVTLVFGWLVLGVDLSPSAGRVAYTILAFVIGIAGVVAMGFIVVSAALTITGDAWRMPEAVAAALYLVSGAIFPVTVLPGSLQAVSKAVPLTWWLEAMRRGLLGPDAVRSIPWAGDAAVLAILAGVVAAAVVVAAAAFTWAQRRTRRLGILDRESMF